MTTLSDEQIQLRAHELWEEAGRPEGRDEEFWHQAEQELRKEDLSQPPNNLPG